MLRNGLLLQRASAGLSHSQKAKLNSMSPKFLWERLMTAPKGFGKFYPPSSGSAGKGASKTAENVSKASKGKAPGGGGSSGGGNKNKQEPPETWKAVLLTLAAAGALTALASGDSKHGR
jgi:hypothetical protein